MKFPRNARVFRGQIDAAPFASVFFLLVIFVLLESLVYTPGVRIQLPVADDLSGVPGPTIAVAVYTNGQYYFRNQLIGEGDLTAQLRSAAASSPEPLTLVVQADRETKRESLDHLALIARNAGIREMLLATLPRVFEPTAGASPNAP